MTRLLLMTVPFSGDIPAEPMEAHANAGTGMNESNESKNSEQEGFDLMASLTVYEKNQEIKKVKILIIQTSKKFDFTNRIMTNFLGVMV